MRMGVLALTLFVFVSAMPIHAADSAADGLKLYTRSRVKSTEQQGQFDVVCKTVQWDPQKTAIIICDMWDHHWCKGAEGREAEMAPRMNDFISEARRRGVLIIHAPSGCMTAYENHPARQRAKDAPPAKLPVFLKDWQNNLLDAEKQGVWPIDQSDGGCDCTPQCPRGSPWRRQIDTLKIADEDAISDSGFQIGRLFAQRGIDNVMLMGVHTNMCVIGRPFGLRSMVRLGKNVVLVRDLTDTMYNSRKAPQVSHVRGTELIVEYIEKYVCPTITSSDLLGGPALRFQADKRPHVAIIASEDEYRSEKTLPAFAQTLETRYGCYCTLATGQGAKTSGQGEIIGQGVPEIIGLDELKTADVMVLYARRRALPKEQLAAIRNYLDAGKPLVALRTACHAFHIRVGKAPAGSEQWPTFDHDVLGGNYQGHITGGPESKAHTDVSIAPDAAGDPILAGVEPTKWASNGTLYLTSPIDPQAKLLLIGSADGKTEPVAWTRAYKGGRVFFTSLGHEDDFATPQFRTLLLNAIYWAMNRPVPNGVAK